MSEDFDKILLNTFLEEASFLIEDLEVTLLALDEGKERSESLAKIFRAAHSIKGSAASVGLSELSAFGHVFEDCLGVLRADPSRVTPEAVSLLLEGVDAMKVRVASIKQGVTSKHGAATDPWIVEPLIERIRELTRGMTGSASTVKSNTDNTPAFGFFDDDGLAKTNTNQIHSEQASANLPSIQSAAAPSSPPAADETIRVNLGRIDHLMDTVGEIVIIQTVLSQHRKSLGTPLLQKMVGQLQKITCELQDISMSLRLVPLSRTFQKLQRIVRDTSINLGKEVNFVMSGDTTEVDKSVVDMLGDPLVHLVRNAVDHGIEAAERRTGHGKDPVGHISLKAYQESGRIVIEVTDDGNGLDPNKLVTKAIEKGLLPAGARLSPEDAYQLILLPGFSTKSEITNVSGRGVGLDVVKTNIEALHGEIKIDTELGKGTTFRIFLPLTLAIIDGMIVHLGNERYVVPVSDILESIRPKQEDVSTVAGQDSILTVRDATMPLISLTSLLNRPVKVRHPCESIAIVVKDSSDCKAAILVDEISRKQQVVVKRLGKEMQGLVGFSGSAVLGDGKAALILDLNEFLNGRPNGSHSKLQSRKEAV